MPPTDTPAIPDAEPPRAGPVAGPAEAWLRRDPGAPDRLRAAPGRGVLLVATAAAGAEWALLRDLAGLARRAGGMPWLLLCAAPSALAAAEAEILAHLDLAVALRPARDLAVAEPSAAWDSPPPDPVLEPALAALLATLGPPAALVAETPHLLARLGAPAAAPRRAVALPHGPATAPRRLFPGPPRQRLLARMRDRLAGVTAVLPDEAARLALLQLCPGAATLVAGPGAPAGPAAAALGLPPGLSPVADSLEAALWRRLLAARLADGVPTGLLLDGLEGGRLAETFAALAGPGRLFRLGGGAGAPLGSAAALGVARILVGGAGREAAALAGAVAAWGLEARPLLAPREGG